MTIVVYLTINSDDLETYPEYREVEFSELVRRNVP